MLQPDSFMKKAVITGKRRSEIITVPRPTAVNDWVLVKIHAAPMCTEYKEYETGEASDYLGHEAAGEVVEAAKAGSLKVGDRVVVMPQYPCGKCSLCTSGEYIHCQDNLDFEKITGSREGSATYAQYLLKPAWLLPAIPGGISYEHAAMLCCGLGPTFGAMERMQVQAMDTVLIVGLGPVGLGGIINGVSRDARILGVSHNPYRANLARELGAEMVFDSYDPDVLLRIYEYTGGKGVDKAIDCAGSLPAQRLMIDAARRNGKIAFVGESADLPVNVSNDLLRKGLTIYGIWHYNLNGIPRLFRLVKEERRKLDILITHEFALENVQDAWELQLSRQCGKVILKPWD